MSNKHKNYLDVIKNKKIQDKFIEHFIRLLFFTVILSIEAVYKKSRDIIYHIKNILKRRTLSDMLKKYRHYRESVNDMLQNRAPVKNLHHTIHETIDRLFSDDEKKLVFGIKDSTQSFMEKSRQIITTVSDYTRTVRGKYFSYRPFAVNDKSYPTSMLTLYILKKYRNVNSRFNISIDPKLKKQYVEIHSSGYKKFISDTITRFYSTEFKKKIKIGQMDSESLKPQIKKIIDTIEKLERRQIRYTFGQS